jgi:putative oxidoreductase
MQATRAETLSRGRARARTIGIATGAPLALRTVIGIVMAAHGWQKVQQGVGEFAGFVESLSIPFPTFTAYAVTALELGGGILLILGLATRQWALLIGLEMVLTTILVKVDVGLIADGGAGAELDLLILAGCLALVLLGPGRVSLDRAFGIDGKSDAVAI